MRSVKEKEPKNIQPYYRAWMNENPNEPRAWEQEWKNNLHFSSWIRSKHFEFKKNILGRNMNNYFQKNAPYSKSDQEHFLKWLFADPINDCSCKGKTKDLGFCIYCDTQIEN